MEQFRQIAIDKEALLEGHFLLSSGLHSNAYFQCAKLLQWPEIARQFGEELMNRVISEAKLESPEVVLAPAMGGLFIGHETARAFNTRSVFLERVDGQFQLKRGFELKDDEKVLIVEDVFTTGKSTMEVVDFIQKNSKAQIIGVSCLASRLTEERESAFKKELEEKGVPAQFVSVLKINADAWTEADCPACKEGLPVIKPGSRKVFT